MNDELEFRSTAEAALESLKRHLMASEQEDHDGFEVKEQDGILTILFDDPAARFVITANAPMRQIWISALAASFMLNWDAKMEEFILPRTGETLATLVNRLISEYHAPGSSHI